MKIGLIFPNKDRKDKTVHLGLGYIAAYARSQHSDIEIILLDTRVATYKETKQFFNHHFDLLGITVLSPVYSEVITLFDHIKSIQPQTLICLGGPYVTTIREDIFNITPADYAVYGEGEITFSDLIYHLKGMKRIEEIPGIMYRSDEGVIISNPPREQISDLDDLPLPAYDLFKMDRYPMHRIATSRGCPFSCSFCNSSAIWSFNWRSRSARSVYDEIVYLTKTYRKKPVFFNDNSFNIDLSRVSEFCDLVISKNLKILWSTPVRAELITPEIARKMKKAGCYNVSIGVESSDNKVLRKINKNTTIEKTTAGIKTFKSAGIEVTGQFMIGNPGDNLATIRESLDFAKKSELDFVLFYSTLPFKGTQLWEYVVREGRFLNDTIHNYHATKPRIVFDTPGFSYQERFEAIKMAEEAGYYSGSNDRSIIFDFFKDSAKILYQTLPSSSGDKVYLFLKNFYRKYF